MRVLLIAALVACGGHHHVLDEKAGGDLTVVDRTATAYTHAAPGLTQEQMGKHIAGQGQFNFAWESPLLGPQFNNSMCGACHAGDGRGLSQIGTGSASQSLIRVSVGSGEPVFPGGPVPVPGFGLQLHDHAVDGIQQINVAQSWIERPGKFGDGAAFSLRVPNLDVRLPDGSEFPRDAMRSYRQPPAVFGLGLLEAVPASTILALADPTLVKPDGIHGVANMVWSVEHKQVMLGRFGQKANVPTIVEQVAGAFANDIGLTNPFFPDAHGNTEIGGDALTNVMFFVQTEAVPAPAPLDGDADRGSELFDQFHCSACHMPTLITGDSPLPMLAHQTIHSYTDLLVHQMGSGLADNRPDFKADGQSFRTTPLWGLGLVQVVSPHATFLHDGRARTIEEAILWHGGEAAAAEEAYRNAASADRTALLDFLSCL